MLRGGDGVETNRGRASGKIDANIEQESERLGIWLKIRLIT